MRRTIHKGFFAWAHEKEELWLNGLSARGLQLVSVGFCTYVVEDSDREKYIYRIEYMKSAPASAEGAAYIRFLEETGVEHVATYLRWAYFRKRASEGPFELYSDLTSKIAHQRRISILLWAIGLSNALIGFANIMANRDDLGSVSALYLLNGVLAALLFFGAIRVELKIRKLKREQNIYE